MKELKKLFYWKWAILFLGYRPIFDAFKSMASDATPDLTNRIPDIEDMDKVKKCNNLDQWFLTF